MTGNDFEMDLIYGDGQMSLPTGVHIRHSMSSETEVLVEHLEVSFESTNADGVYPLTAVSDNETSQSGDEYRLTEADVGADPLMDDAGYTIKLWYHSPKVRGWLSEIHADPLDEN